MVTATEQEIQVREIGEDEVETFFTKGWVRLPGLLEPDAALALRDRAAQLLGVDPDGNLVRPGLDYTDARTRTFRAPARDEHLFGSLAHSEHLGKAAATLLERDSSICLFGDTLLLGLPEREAAPGGSPATYRQGYWGEPLDRNGVAYWIALDSSEPALGGPVFLTGSHKLSEIAIGPITEQWIDDWPRLAACPVDTPGPLRPGDAIAWINGAVMRIAANHGDRPRWSYLVSHVPADARFLQYPGVFADGYGFKYMETLEVLDLPAFPVIYRGSAPEIPMGAGKTRIKEGTTPVVYASRPGESPKETIDQTGGS